MVAESSRRSASRAAPRSAHAAAHRRRLLVLRTLALPAAALLAPVVVESYHANLPLIRHNPLAALLLLALLVLAVVVVRQDLRDRRATEEELRRSEEQFHTVLHRVPIVLFATDAEGVFTVSEGKGLEALGQTPGAVVGRSLFDVYRHAPLIVDAARRALAGEEVSMVTAVAGRVYEIWHTPLWGEEGAVVGLIGVATDVTERVRAERQSSARLQQIEAANAALEAQKAVLETLATQDGLTGLLNHRAFQERLAEAFQYAARYETPLSLLLLDVDHFKDFNDAYGHPAGDAVLQKVGGVLRHQARAPDEVARYGGEEFAVILPHTDGEGAVAIAERIRAAIAAHDWDKRAVTVSVGVAHLTRDLPDPASLLAAADSALYRAKAAGRNCVVYG